MFPGCLISNVNVSLFYRILSSYLSGFFSLPVVRSTGERLNHEQVVNQLDTDTVEYTTSYGAVSGFAETFHVSIRVELDQYGTAISWLKDLLHGSVFEKER